MSSWYSNRCDGKEETNGECMKVKIYIQSFVRHFCPKLESEAQSSNKMSQERRHWKQRFMRRTVCFMRYESQTNSTKLETIAEDPKLMYCMEGPSMKTWTFLRETEIMTDAKPTQSLSVSSLTPVDCRLCHEQSLGRLLGNIWKHWDVQNVGNLWFESLLKLWI